MLGINDKVRNVMGVLVCAGLSVSVAQAGVFGSVWVEVDNSVGTIGEAAGLPTGLDGVRTFDLYAIVTPDTEIYVADFGFVRAVRGQRPMRTGHRVYQNPIGGDTQSRNIGAVRMGEFAALEFDTYVGLGRIDTTIVRNTGILGADWTSSGFKAAWFASPTSKSTIEPARPDESGRVFLARISVYAPGEFGDTSNAGSLGGAFFLSGEDRHGGFGRLNPDTGKFWAKNAFAGPSPVYFTSSEGPHWGEDDADNSDNNNDNDNADAGGDVDTGDDANAPDDTGVDDEQSAPRDRFDGDMNYDGVVDALDMAAMQSAYGTLNPNYDLNGDMLIEESDVRILLYLIDGTLPELNKPLSPKAQKKAVKRYEKLMKKAKKKVVKDRKGVEKERRKTLKRAKKELKKQEREAKKAAKKAAKGKKGQ